MIKTAPNKSFYGLEALDEKIKKTHLEIVSIFQDADVSTYESILVLSGFLEGIFRTYEVLGAPILHLHSEEFSKILKKFNIDNGIVVGRNLNGDDNLNEIREEFRKHHDITLALDKNEKNKNN